MIFTKTGRLLKNYKFHYKKTDLKCVREYKYLGFLVTPSGEISSGLEDLRIRALKALAKIKKALGIQFRLNVNNTLHLLGICSLLMDYWTYSKPRLTKQRTVERRHAYMT